MNTRTYFGFWIYILSDCVLFAGLFATYAVLSGNTAGGPELGDFLNLPFVLAETLILLTSSFTMGMGLLAAHSETGWRSRPRGAALSVSFALAATLVLGLAFLGLEASEFRHLIVAGSGPDKSAFLSAFFTLLGVHGAHVAAGSLWMLTLLVRLWRGHKDQTALQCLALFWHFLDIIWIFIFTFVYLFGAL